MIEIEYNKPLISFEIDLIKSSIIEELKDVNNNKKRINVINNMKKMLAGFDYIKSVTVIDNLKTVKIDCNGLSLNEVMKKVYEIGKKNSD